MKPSFSLTDGYRELLFGQWMPHILFEQYEADPLLLVDRMWEIPDNPESYLNTNRMLLTRWQALGDSVEDLQEWIPPFYQLTDQYREPFHPICRFYTGILWCENRMILKVLQQWQEHLELTIFRYELVILQNQMVGYLKECQKRIPDTGKSPVEKLSQYLYSLAGDSIIILLLEINERFSHHLAEKRLGIEELFIRVLRTSVPRQRKWTSTPARVKWKLRKIGRPKDTIQEIHNLLLEIKEEYNQQSKTESQEMLVESIHLLENAWFCQIVRFDFQNNKLDLSNPEQCRSMILRWKDLFLTCKLDSTRTNDRDDQKIFHHIVRHLATILDVLETKREPLSEAAELALLVKDLFSEERATAQSGTTFQTNSKPDSDGHWLLDQYIPLFAIQKKLDVTPRTMRTYIRDYNLEVSEITAKNKWVKADDFEAFMEQFKKKGTHS